VENNTIINSNEAGQLSDRIFQQHSKIIFKDIKTTIFKPKIIKTNKKDLLSIKKQMSL
jgi:hypothetical protein